jgi:hypothetical protein
MAINAKAAPVARVGTCGKGTGQTLSKLRLPQRRSWCCASERSGFS